MPPQTSYAEQAAGFSGLLSGIGPKQVASYVQGEATAEMPFGDFVARTAAPTDGTPGTCVNLVDANSVIAGVVVHSHAYDARTELGTTGIKPGAMVSILEKGRIWMHAEKAVTFDDAVFVRHTAGGGERVGDLRDDADTSDAIQVYGARFVTATTAAGLVLVDFDVNAYRAGKAAA